MTTHVVVFPVIVLKSGWNVDVDETGGVRLWLQTESLSDSAEIRLIFNDREISSTPVRTADDAAPVLLRVIGLKLQQLGKKWNKVCQPRQRLWRVLQFKWPLAWKCVFNNRKTSLICAKRNKLVHNVINASALVAILHQYTCMNALDSLVACPFAK